MDGRAPTIASTTYAQCLVAEEVHDDMQCALAPEPQLHFRVLRIGSSHREIRILEHREQNFTQRRHHPLRTKDVDDQSHVSRRGSTHLRPALTEGIG